MNLKYFKGAIDETSHLASTREHELRGAIKAGIASVVEYDGKIAGYSTGVGFFGHSVAESNDALKAIIGAATSSSSPGFLLPSRNAEMMRWCLANGLRIVQPMTLTNETPIESPIIVKFRKVIICH